MIEGKAEIPEFPPALTKDRDDGSLALDDFGAELVYRKVVQIAMREGVVAQVLPALEPVSKDGLSFGLADLADSLLVDEGDRGRVMPGERGQNGPVDLLRVGGAAAARQRQIVERKGDRAGLRRTESATHEDHDAGGHYRSAHIRSPQTAWPPQSV